MSLLDLVQSPGSAQRWPTRAGVTVTRTTERAAGAASTRTRLEDALDHRRGMLLFRGDDRAVGYVDPPVEVVVRSGWVAVTALNDRGLVLLDPLRRVLREVLRDLRDDERGFHGIAPRPAPGFAEEDRTRHAGVFRAVRALTAALALPHDPVLGLYGAFGYDLLFQVEPVELRQPRDPMDRDLVLHLPDEVLDFDFERDLVALHRYEFTTAGASTEGLPRGTSSAPFVPATPVAPRDHEPGEYAAVVREAMPRFAAGELFEVVPSQVFRRACPHPPAELFRGLRDRNPAPHSLLANLGEGEHLVGASPEMFVRVRAGERGLVVESSPISGTIARGRDALEDAARVRELLDSAKDETELTMCTDVDRNDKARVCVPGTVRVTARRRIETYSTLIHTVDRVEGVLRPGMDALDGFLAHLWAVTVTGAPKLAAVEFVERHERSPRRWYGGAVGRVGFDGGLDTVLTLRTIQVRHGVAIVRAGATLLHDSVPEAEEAETELKAKALLDVLDGRPRRPATAAAPRGGRDRRVLLVDHRDSFVHNLADYLRQTGAQVVTHRAGTHLGPLAGQRPDLVVLSPGPGRPDDFDVAGTLAEARRLGVPVFGVCLGLQGVVEHLGGSLGVLDRPVHGKSSSVRVLDAASPLFRGVPDGFRVGRYHSLHAVSLPPELRVTAASDDGVVMAVEHRELPWAAVQFHPESIMTWDGGAGHAVIANAVVSLAGRGVRR
ncbi:anthranilate synthase component I [Saccharothrix xinjiangensis]|uniref:Anthranilate synthase component I n=1 Tax=Saccharothrix xinjiangensis TaxID=204798 RepID=A0ABV9XXY9_9PSEU